MNNNFNDRFTTYFNFLNQKQGNENIQVILRELKKIFQLGIDDFYSASQRRKIVNELISSANNRKNDEEKASCLLFAYKINKACNFEINIQTLYLNETLIVNKETPKSIPNSFKKVMSQRHLNRLIVNMDQMKLDEDAKNLFNIQIFDAYFQWNKMSISLR